MMIEPGTWECESGAEARVFATDGAEPFPVLGAVKDPAGHWEAQSWTADGRLLSSGERCRLDLKTRTGDLPAHCKGKSE